jgi:hypothetical protein
VAAEGDEAGPETHSAQGSDNEGNTAVVLVVCKVIPSSLGLVSMSTVISHTGIAYKVCLHGMLVIIATSVLQLRVRAYLPELHAGLLLQCAIM